MPYAMVNKTGSHLWTITVHAVDGEQIDQCAGTTWGSCSRWIAWLPHKLRLRLCRDRHEPPQDMVLAELKRRGWIRDEPVPPGATVIDVEARWTCPKCVGYVAITSSTKTGDPHRVKCSSAHGCGWVGGIFEVAGAEVIETTVETTFVGVLAVIAVPPGTNLDQLHDEIADTGSLGPHVQYLAVTTDLDARISDNTEPSSWIDPFVKATRGHESSSRATP